MAMRCTNEYRYQTGTDTDRKTRQNRYRYSTSDTIQVVYQKHSTAQHQQRSGNATHRIASRPPRVSDKYIGAHSSNLDRIEFTYGYIDLFECRIPCASALSPPRWIYAGSYARTRARARARAREKQNQKVSGAQRGGEKSAWRCSCIADGYRLLLSAQLCLRRTEYNMNLRTGEKKGEAKEPLLCFSCQ